MDWFVMRVTYSREVMFKEYLDAQKIENFLPMQYEYVEIDGKMHRKLMPVVHNLVFVRSTRQQMDEIKTQTSTRIPVRYIIDRSKNAPMTVPDRQMSYFITVASAENEKIVYLDVTKLKRGVPVRITGGPFAGVEGEFMRVKGDRRVVVAIKGLMAVATAFIHPAYLETM
jgi:transcription antitermination factor NusG